MNENYNWSVCCPRISVGPKQEEKNISRLCDDLGQNVPVDWVEKGIPSEKIDSLRQMADDLGQYVPAEWVE